MNSKKVKRNSFNSSTYSADYLNIVCIGLSQKLSILFFYAKSDLAESKIAFSVYRLIKIYKIFFQKKPENLLSMDRNRIQL